MADAGLSLHFTSVATKPGKPTTYASAGNRTAFGLPGNPVAVYLTFHLYVLRAAARLAGSPWPVRVLRLPLAEEFRRRKAERQEYRPCRLSDDGRLVPLEFHGTAHLAALRDADGLFAVPRDCQWIGAGERVEFLSVGRLFR
jgi:molybdopterin molybdotransferase